MLLRKKKRDIIDIDYKCYFFLLYSVLRLLENVLLSYYDIIIMRIIMVLLIML